MNGHTLRKVITHLKKGIKIRNQQIELFNKRLVEDMHDIPTDRLMKRYRSVNPETRQVDLLEPLSNDDLLMMNPFLSNRKMYHSEHIRGWWKEILSACAFQEKYTLYSLRSTHITHALLKGMNIRKVAENCGTSENEVIATYQRLNNLLNKDELGFFKNKVEETFIGEGGS
tara:strand:- start:339 stop:851 length:513 start_codon:yes stop_codon:yes gene_type:complete